MKVQTSSSKIPCRICGQLFHSINNTHLGSRHRIRIDEYQRLYGGPIKSDEYKKVAYRNHSSMMRQLRKSGVVTPPPLSEEVRHSSSERMKLNNPMKNKTVAECVGQMLKGKSSYRRTYKHRVIQRELKLGSKKPQLQGGCWSRVHVVEKG